MTVEITLTITPDSAELGANVGDWFRGGWAIINKARAAKTPQEADAILRGAYLGPDVDGAEVKWEIEE